MIKCFLLICCITSLTNLTPCDAQTGALKNGRNLFNGKDLTGWETYLGPVFDENGHAAKGAPSLGLNNDPQKVFSVVTVDGKKALRVSGEVFGGINTAETFKNYHLQLQFKWGVLKWAPKKKAKRDSGLLYFANGQQGAADGGLWMQAQEFQIQETDCGDYWGVAGGMFDVPTRKENDSTYRYDPNGEMRTFQDKPPVGRRAFKSVDAENPTGQWNTLDLYCSGDTAVHVVNGKTVMVLYHSKHTVDGKVVPLSEGKIQLQSEGAEVFYRHIRLQPIDGIPAGVLK